MFAKNKHSYIYYFAVGLLLAAVYFIQSSTGLLPEIFSVRPNAALTLLVCFAMFGGEWAGMISGLCLGIATDVISAAPDGFNALFMMITGLVCALLSTYLFNRRLPAAMVLCGICCAVYYVAYWAVRVLPAGYDGAWLYLARYSLPAALYSWLFVFPFWAVVGAMSRPHARVKKSEFLE